MPAQLQHSRKRYQRQFRASRACERCKLRKVRCDVVRKDGDAPCTNCDLDKVECVDGGPTTVRRVRHGGDKRRSRNAQDQISSPVRLRSPQQLSSQMTMPRQSRNVAALAHHQDITHEELDPSGRSSSYPRDLFLAESGEAITSQEMAETPMIPPNCNDTSPISTRLHAQTASHAIDMRLNATTSVSTTRSSPMFMSGTPDAGDPTWAPTVNMRPPLDFDSEDMSLLVSRRVFQFPPPEVCIALIRSFVDHVYPLLPVLDLHEFLHSLFSDSTENGVSLLLLYAVMLSGSSYVDSTHILGAGQRNRLTLRKVLAKRARLLYDFDYEKDRLVTVQALILMTYYHDKSDDRKHLSHWIAIAKQLALTIGLHGNFSKERVDDRKMHVWKRVWWCCYIRDRTIAFGARRHPLIGRADCQWSDLEVEDFGYLTSSPKIDAVFGDCRILFDPALHIRLAELCIFQLKLCHVLTDIMTTRYVETFPRYGLTSDSTLILMPDAIPGDSPAVQNCHQKLERWLSDLPELFVYRHPPSPEFDSADIIFRSSVCQVNLLYHTLNCMLHRSSPLCPYGVIYDVEDLSRRRLRSASSLVLSIFEYLHIHGLVQFMPPWAVSVLMHTALTYRTSCSALQRQAERRIQDCVDYLECLTDAYVHASSGISLLNAVLYRSKKPERNPTSADTNAGQADASGTYIQGGRSLINDPSASQSQLEMRIPISDSAYHELGVQEEFWFADFSAQDLWSPDPNI